MPKTADLSNNVTYIGPQIVILAKGLTGLAFVGLICVPLAKAQSTVDQSLASRTTEITSFALRNVGEKAISGEMVSLAIPLQTGDVPVGNQIQIRKSDGTTVVLTQQDACSKWAQDNSLKVCSISFVEPDSISPNHSSKYEVFSVGDPPNSAPRVTKASILANTDILLKTSNLMEAQGRLEQGTWDLISLNYILGHCAEYSRTTGYGANPHCGWDVVAQGPIRYGLHAFQYALRESDHATHDWVRSDLWVDFWGSASSPCPCSVAVQVSQPNTWGPIAGGSVGSLPEGGYIFSAQLYNGSQFIYALGGQGDRRASQVSFDGANSKVIFSGGNKSWVQNAAGVFGVAFSGGAPPAGLKTGTVYFFNSYGSNSDLRSDRFSLYPYQCAAAEHCPAAVAPIRFTNNGEGTIIATPVVMTTPFSGFLGLDSAAQRFWIGETGTLVAPPPLLVGHEFKYLTQKSKAVPPYITGLFGRLLATPGPAYAFYPGSYYFPLDINAAGDGPGDERIGYINRTGVYTLFMPNDSIAAQNSLVLAASFGIQQMYHQDERVGLPDVFNNGPAKDGKTYPTLGVVQPNQRTYPYSDAKWLRPSTNFSDLSAIAERYGVRLDPSHMPAPQQAPYLKTGQPEWREQLDQEANAVVGNMQITTAKVGKNTYYRVLAPALKGFSNEQTRGVAWARRIGDMADFFEPAGSPLSQYFHNLVADDVDYMDDFAANGTNRADKSLGYFWNDVQDDTSSYQWWQDDFVFLSYGMNAWRGEYPRAASFLKNYFYKQVITRMDADSPVGGGGCLWAGPAREVGPFGKGNDPVALPTTWDAFFAKNAAGKWQTTWSGCESKKGGLIVDGAGTNPTVPNGLTSIMAVSPAIGSLIGIPHAAELYASIRKLQYHGPCTNCAISLSFLSFKYSGSYISEPTFAIGPIDAEN